MADIGDMQSVSGDLSTFSGHLVICREILDRVQMLSKKRLSSHRDSDIDELNNYDSNNDDEHDDHNDHSVRNGEVNDDQKVFSSLVLLDEIGTGKLCRSIIMIITLYCHRQEAHHYHLLYYYRCYLTSSSPSTIITDIYHHHHHPPSSLASTIITDIYHHHRLPSSLTSTIIITIHHRH